MKTAVISDGILLAAHKYLLSNDMAYIRRGLCFLKCLFKEMWSDVGFLICQSAASTEHTQELKPAIQPEYNSVV